MPSAPSQSWWFPAPPQAASQRSPSDGWRLPTGCSETVYLPPDDEFHASDPRTQPTRYHTHTHTHTHTHQLTVTNASLSLSLAETPLMELFITDGSWMLPGSVLRQKHVSGGWCSPPRVRCSPAADEPLWTWTPWCRRADETSAAPPSDCSVRPQKQLVSVCFLLRITAILWNTIQI